MLPNLPFSPIGNNSKIIGIHGKAGSGKDTLANFIREHIWDVDENLSVHILPFAAGLKSVTAELFSFPLLLSNDRLEKEKKLSCIPYSPRELLQWVGTELIRNNLDPDFWIKKLSWDIAQQQESNPNETTYYIIPDVRFDNEANWILSQANGRLILLDRPEATGNVGLVGHSSEAGIDSVYMKEAYNIQNNGTLADLNSSAYHFVTSF